MSGPRPIASKYQKIYELRSVGCADTMKLDDVISRNPEVMSGALVFRGTRVPVQTLIDYLKAGETLDRFLDGFPTVSRKQAEAYLQLTLGEAEAHA